MLGLKNHSMIFSSRKRKETPHEIWGLYRWAFIRLIRFCLLEKSDVLRICQISEFEIFPRQSNEWRRFVNGQLLLVSRKKEYEWSLDCNLNYATRDFCLVFSCFTRMYLFHVSIIFRVSYKANWIVKLVRRSLKTFVSSVELHNSSSQLVSRVRKTCVIGVVVRTHVASALGVVATWLTQNPRAATAWYKSQLVAPRGSHYTSSPWQE